MPWISDIRVLLSDILVYNMAGANVTEANETALSTKSHDKTNRCGGSSRRNDEKRVFFMQKVVFMYTLYTWYVV